MIRVLVGVEMWNHLDWQELESGKLDCQRVLDRLKKSSLYRGVSVQNKKSGYRKFVNLGESSASKCGGHKTPRLTRIRKWEARLSVVSR